MDSISSICFGQKSAISPAALPFFHGAHNERGVRSFGVVEYKRAEVVRRHEDAVSLLCCSINALENPVPIPKTSLADGEHWGERYVRGGKLWSAHVPILKKLRNSRPSIFVFLSNFFFQKLLPPRSPSAVHYRSLFLPIACGWEGLGNPGRKMFRRR